MQADKNVQTTLEIANAKDCLLRFLLATDCDSEELKRLIQDPDSQATLSFTPTDWTLSATADGNGVFRSKRITRLPEVPNT